MNANSFGRIWKITTFGESHGPALGVVIDGCPAGVTFDLERLKLELLRRRPGTSEVTSSRNEQDEPEVLSGIYNGVTLGTPIALMVKNHDARSGDYEAFPPRTGHADDLWKKKFLHSDPRGGGRASGRETVARVLAGSVALMFIKSQMPGLSIQARLLELGPLHPQCPPHVLTPETVELLRLAKLEGQSYGAQVQYCIQGVPALLGQPVFHKLKADLAHAIIGVGGVNALDFGVGTLAAQQKGTEFHSSAMGTESQRYGGIRGGISTGEDILMKVTFKPTASIGECAKTGRHDPCIAIRASVVVEHMIYNVLADHILMRRLDTSERS